ncbi:hypothetical protein [Colwellia sp. Bg11-28]|uniref:hypothetical protein n=1 Tax=Colwellia sp. Bg11-28 TaxID=2058305 RepID=UPI000C33782A|nr:hypothetical protein [Colwellia sp. Bg11-28]PKH87098.1 hypothetical protein CXF79_10395 [Colwellia sp. Bg11-28]
MKKLYQSTRLLMLLILLIIMSNKTFAEDVIDITIIDVAPVLLEELDQIRGLGGVVDVTSNANLGAELTNNGVNNSVTGYNIIDQGSFTDASGVFSIIQNTGNNVIIQDSTIITITITPE